jgi:integrase
MIFKAVLKLGGQEGRKVGNAKTFVKGKPGGLADSFEGNCEMHDVLKSYLASHQLSRSYVQSLRRTVNRAFRCGIRRVSEISSDAVNSFLLSQDDVSRTTLSNYRREILTLWRFAYETGMTDARPDRIVRIKPERRPVEAWTRAELQAMLAYAEADKTPLGGVSSLRVCDVMPAWIGVGFDTAIRFTDVLHLQIDDFRNGGEVVALTANKTNKPLVRPLSEHTQHCCARLFTRSPDGSLFAWALTRRRAILMWRDFLRRHDIRGSSKWLRRSCATQLAIEAGSAAAATNYLQHSSPHLVHASYIDASQAAVPQGPTPLQPR